MIHWRALDGGHFDHAGKPRASAGQKTGDQSNSADRNSRDLGRSHIAADGANLETERRLANQDPSQQTSDQAEDQPPMDRRVAERLEHLLIRDRIAGGFVQTARIAIQVLIAWFRIAMAM